MEKKIIFITILLIIINIGCSNKKSIKKETNLNKQEIKQEFKEEAEIKTIAMTADKSIITANGKEIVKFTVKGDKEQILEYKDIVIYYGDGKVLLDETFTTDTPSEYKFKAKYKEIESNEIIVAAEPDYKEIKVEVDKTVFLADNKDKVFFAIKDENGEVIKSTRLEFYKNGEKFNSREFATDIPEKYEFYAKYLDKESEKIFVNAEFTLEKLVLEADKKEIKGDNKEEVVFKFKNEKGKEVFDNKIEIYKNGDKMEGTYFKSDKNGEYEFKAKFKDIESESLKVKVNLYFEKLKLVSDKDIIMDDNIEELSFKFKNEKDEEIFDEKIEIFYTYMKEEPKIEKKYTGMTFKSGKYGEYEFYAKYNDSKSEILKIKVDKRDKIPPKAILKFPVENEKEVGVERPIEVIFDENIDKTKATVMEFKVIRDEREPVVGELVYNEGLKKLTFTPKSKLKYGYKYKVVLTKEIRDNFENNLENDIIWEFKTAKLTKPITYLVEGGEFNMGDETGELWQINRPVHKVKLSYDYYIGIYEVTFEEFDIFTKYIDKKSVDDSGWGRMKQPVINVTWNDAIKYCNWLSGQEDLPPAYDEKTGELLDEKGNKTEDIKNVKGYRLLTEAEWEYAARGGKKTQNFIYSGNNDMDGVAWYTYNSQGKAKDVGKKALNELGIYDMSGNVWEWTNDKYSEYEEKPLENPIGSKNSNYRVIRGGAWNSVVYDIRVAARDYYYPSIFNNTIGFRIAKTK